uniref:Enoyl reductase (ER) domain-containing protein n=1 Tax=Pyrodinium bahamense TaxID=73915 RepID=A0A7S0FWB3_9DINO
MAALATASAAALGGVALLSWRWSRPQSMEDVPARMKRLVLVEANKDIAQARLEVEEVDTPKPRKGQVLIKVAAAPVNPSDDGVWKVPPKKGYPLALGNEGSGKVVASGGGLLASRLLGKNVAFAVTGVPTYAEYAVAKAEIIPRIFTLPPGLPAEDGCAFFVNPFTVVGIVETIKEQGGKAFIHTAAASQLGQMMVKYCKCEGITLVNLVRRQEQVALLQGLGAEHIVNTGESDWQAKLARLIADLKIKYAFDAIAGEMPGNLLTMLPPGSTVWVYGVLSKDPVGNIQSLDLIYRGKKIEGFLLLSWIMKDGMLKGFLRFTRTANKVRKHIKGVFASEFRETTLAGMHADYCSASSMTGVKMRVRPHGG